jgi:Tfp pilus assembly protein PilF
MRWRVLLTFVLAWILTIPLSLAHGDQTLQQRYLEIYLKINDAEHSEKQGDYKGALDDFKDCYLKLEKIHQSDPNWETALVVHRMQDCQAKITDLQPKADAQVSSPISPPPVIGPNPTDTNNPPSATAPTPDVAGNPDEVNSLKLQLQAVREELRITKEKLQDSQAQLETYRTQLETVNAKLADLKGQQTVDDRMAKLTNDNKDLTDKLTAAQKEIDDFKSNPKSKLAMALAQLKNLQDQFDESQASNRALQDTTTTLKQQLDQAQADLVAANQKLAATQAGTPDYEALKRENEVMRDILTRELQEQAHRDMAKRLAQEEFDNLKLKSKVLQENLDILASPMTPATNDEERTLLASLKAPTPDVNTPPANPNGFAAPAAGTPSAPTDPATTTTPPETTTTNNAPMPADTTTNQTGVAIVMNTPPATPTPDTNAAPDPSATNAAPATNPAPSAPPAPDTNTATQPAPTTNTPDANAPVSPATQTAADPTNAPPTPAPPAPPAAPPTTTKIPPADTVVQDTTITHGNSTDPSDPTQFSTKARLPDDMRDTAQEAADLFKNQKYDESAAKYQNIIDKYPESLYAWSNLGVVRFQQGKFDEALKALQQAVKLSPTDAFSYSNLGIVYYQLGQYENAIEALNSAKALDPNDAKTHNYLGCACSQKGWQEVAEKEFRKAIELDPNFGDAHFNLALVYATSKPPSLELARREYNRALELGIAKDARLEKLLNGAVSP